MVNLLAVVGEGVVGGALGHIEDGLEGDLALSGEVSLGHGLIAALGDGLVEVVVLLVSHISGPGDKRCFIKIDI